MLRVWVGKRVPQLVLARDPVDDNVELLLDSTASSCILLVVVAGGAGRPHGPVHDAFRLQPVEEAHRCFGDRQLAEHDFSHPSRKGCTCRRRAAKGHSPLHSGVVECVPQECSQLRFPCLSATLALRETKAPRK